MSFLHTSDKLDCVRVCKQWYELISNTTLYETIDFRHKNNLNQALSLFNKKAYAGRQVRNLDIVAMDLDMRTVLSLPELFPNFKKLVWTEEEESSIRVDDSMKPALKLALKNWKYIESICRFTENLQISSHLLETCICQNLKDLTVSLGDCISLDDNDDRQLYDRMFLQVLIENIHNAPLLKKIYLNFTAIKIIDLENLRNKLPNLQQVGLEVVYLDNDKMMDVIVDKPAKFIKSFSLDFCSRNIDETETVEFERVVANWLFYVGEKYLHTQEIDIHHSDEKDIYLRKPSNLENPLAITLSKMKNLTSYDVGIHPLIRHILDTLDKNDIELKKIFFRSSSYGTGDEQLTQFSQLAHTSKSTLALETLDIRSSYYNDNTIVALSRALINNNSTRLTHVSMPSERNMDVLIVILQNVTMFESLVFGTHSGETINVENDTTSGLKILELGVTYFTQEVATL